MFLLASLLVASSLTAWFISYFWASKSMRKRFHRALFRLGYFLYANTRCGRWMNERSIRKALVKYGEEGHTKVITFNYGSLQVRPIPCTYDNYAYVVVDTKTNDAVVIDAGDGLRVAQYLEANSIVPKAILTTHKHWDHCGGNALLLKRYPSLVVYGSAIDPPNSVTDFLVHEQHVNAGSLDFIAYSTPGHTRGHMVYLLKGTNHGSEADCLFSGDLLFLAGCGRLFEGTAKEMLISLDFICTMPNSTLIWPGHEYAVANLLFSCNVSSDNDAVRDKLTWARHQRQQRLPTCPSTLKEEKQYNLFLRTGDQDLMKYLGVAPPDGSADDDGNGQDATLLARDQQRVQAFQRLRDRKEQQ